MLKTLLEDFLRIKGLKDFYVRGNSRGSKIVEFTVKNAEGQKELLRELQTGSHFYDSYNLCFGYRGDPYDSYYCSFTRKRK